MSEDKKVNRAAVCMIQREDRRYLCVWNKRYGGWSFPGGKVEDTDNSVLAAAMRELHEETGCFVSNEAPHEPVFEGEHGIKVDSTRGSTVSIFSVPIQFVLGEPREIEMGCPVTWLTREEFLKWSPFASFYKRIFFFLDSYSKPVVYESVFEEQKPKSEMACAPPCTCLCHSGVKGFFHCFGDCCTTPVGP
jgi:8-oxo-dGTP pyrophosphatase MutT (NUDIX family)